MWNFIDESNRVFWVVTPKKDMGTKMDEISKQFPGDKKIIVINSEEYQNGNGYNQLAQQIKVDYENENLIFIELSEIAACLIS